MVVGDKIRFNAGPLKGATAVCIEVCPSGVGGIPTEPIPVIQIVIDEASWLNPETRKAMANPLLLPEPFDRLWDVQLLSQ